MAFRRLILITTVLGATALAQPAAAQLGDMVGKARDKAAAAAKKAGTTPVNSTASPAATPPPTPLPAEPQQTAAPATTKDTPNQGDAPQQPDPKPAAAGKSTGGGGDDYQRYQQRQGQIREMGGPKSVRSQANAVDINVGTDGASMALTSMTVSGAGRTKATDPQLRELAGRINADEQKLHQEALEVLASAGQPMGGSDARSDASFGDDLSGKAFDRAYVERQGLILKNEVTIYKSRKAGAANGRMSPVTARFVDHAFTSLSADQAALARIARAAGIATQ